MSSDTKDRERIYNAGDVAALLKVKESTLRKYSLILEEAGYSFYKNEHGQRGFYDRDVIALRRFVEIKNNPDMTLKQAANALMSWVKESDVTGVDTTEVATQDSYNSRYIEEITELKEVVNKQTEMIHTLMKRLDQQEERTNQRDKHLMESLREIQETKRLIAAAAEEKKSLWQRLFSK